jgi:hypothetical protein
LSQVRLAVIAIFKRFIIQRTVIMICISLAVKALGYKPEGYKVITF